MTTQTIMMTACNGDMGDGIRWRSAAGICGWKKRTLYLLLVLLASVAALNVTLTLWIVKILDLGSEGPGKMRFSRSGLDVASDVEFKGTFYARQITAKQNQALRLESSRNVKLMAKNSEGIVSNILSLGHSGFEVIGNYFSVRSRSEKVLLHVDSQEIVVSANRVEVSDSGGFRLGGYLETPLVRGGTTKDLRLEAPLKKVKLRSEDSLHVESPAGGISAAGMRDFHLRSSGGNVVIDGNRIEMKNLKISKGEESREVYQVCACDDGRLFLAHRESYCQIRASVCQGRSRTSFSANKSTS